MVDPHGKSLGQLCHGGIAVVAETILASDRSDYPCQPRNVEGMYDAYSCLISLYMKIGPAGNSVDNLSWDSVHASPDYVGRSQNADYSVVPVQHGCIKFSPLRHDYHFFLCGHASCNGIVETASCYVDNCVGHEIADLCPGQAVAVRIFGQNEFGQKMFCRGNQQLVFYRSFDGVSL